MKEKAKMPERPKVLIASQLSPGDRFRVKRDPDRIYTAKKYVGGHMMCEEPYDRIHGQSHVIRLNDPE